jgi:putative endopeptidase
MSNYFLSGDDFYQHVNSEWLNDPINKIPEDYSSWGGFIKLHDDGLTKQINIVKNMENINRNEEEEKIFAIWKASENRFKSWEENNSDCNPILNELNIFNNHFKNVENMSTETYINSLANYLHYCAINGISNVIEFDSGSDLKNVNNIVLDISTCGMSLPSQEYYKSSDFEEKLNMFRKHLENTNNILKNHNIFLDEDFVNNVINFETMIANYTMKPNQAREYNKYYTNSTLEDIYMKINSLNSLPRKQEENYEENDRDFKLSEDEINKSKILFETLYERFDFRTILENNHDKNFMSADNSPNKYHITTYDGDAIRRCLNLILNADNFQIYHSYIQYKIISNFYSFCTKELDDEFFDFYSRKLGGQEKQKSNDKRSINIVNAFAGEMLGKLFVEKYFSKESKENMKEFVKNVLSIMKNSLNNNDWLTESTKENAVKKLDSFGSKIGYPDVWKDYSDLNITNNDSLYEISKKAKKWNLRVNFFEKINSILDRKEWGMDPQTVNAYFSPTQNEIVFPAAILQPPFFHKTSDTIDFDITEELNMLPNFDVITPANHGGIGAVIAHEITHGYDDKGRNFDSDGNLNDWWNEQDVELFKNKTNIMKDAVSKYKYLDEENEKEYTMNAELTMGENLADIGGLSLSMKSLLKKLNDENASDLLKKVSLRVFFKSWANIWKQNVKKDKRIMLLNIDPHAPTNFRGNLVQHIDEFYDSFDISKDDNMFLNSNERMKMW